MWKHLLIIAYQRAFDWFCFWSFFYYAMRHNSNLQMHSAVSAQAWGGSQGSHHCWNFYSLVNWLMQRSARVSYICMLSEISIRLEGLKVSSTRKFNKAWKNISISNFLIYWSFKEEKKKPVNYTGAIYRNIYCIYLFISSSLEWPSSYPCLHL